MMNQLRFSCKQIDKVEWTRQCDALTVYIYAMENIYYYDSYKFKGIVIMGYKGLGCFMRVYKLNLIAEHNWDTILRLPYISFDNLILTSFVNFHLNTEIEFDKILYSSRCVKRNNKSVQLNVKLIVILNRLKTSSIAFQ